jgi:protein-S-isoprenylcysteine O-methyltransferase
LEKIMSVNRNTLVPTAQRALTAIALIALFYVIPVLGRADALRDPRLVFVMIACATIALTQPPLHPKDLTSPAAADRLSGLGILLAAGISQVSAVVEWGYYSRFPSQHMLCLVSGISMTLLGTVYRMWSIKTLGRFFSSTVAINAGHRVVTSSPYRIVRHPSYLGALVAVTGVPILLQAGISTLITICVMVAAYTYRITVEERALIAQLGEQYLDYRRKTPRLIPLLW